VCPERTEAVEKVGFPEEHRRLGHRKYLGELRKLLVGLPGAIPISAKFSEVSFSTVSTDCGYLVGWWTVRKA
jgi:hypothetical protein